MPESEAIDLGKYSIPQKAWRRATDVLLWYPDNVQEYKDILDAAGRGGLDPTGDAALWLASNVRARRIAQEIEAVERAVSLLRPEEETVIRLRYWDIPKWGRRKTRGYDYIQDSGYSIPAMKKIVHRTIFEIARSLGEV